MAGIVEEITYRPGKFIAAFVPKSSEYNECLEIRVKSTSGNREIIVRQIAGMLARRIVCWLAEKELVTAGQKYGMIKFGSRVEILVAQNVQIAVKLHDRVIGGKTVLGRWL